VEQYFGYPTFVTVSQREDINRLAETILEGLELDLPVDVEEAVTRLGGKLTTSDDKKVEALVRKENDRFEIVIHNDKPNTRKRFSIAHELGHLFLHMGYLIDPTKWGKTEEYKDSVYYRYGYGIEEGEADEFAAAFLMPEKEFRRVIADRSENRRCDIGDIAKFFDASKSAVVRRGQLLGIFSPE
jgi:Zn-dependent peptidase ImmA (M78 family)